MEEVTDKKVFEFKDPSRVEKIVSQYPHKRSATLPLLHLVMAQEGYISPEAIATVAGIVDIHPSEIVDAVSFYSMLYTEPKGETDLQICLTLPCSLRGADVLLDHVCEKLNIQPGETTEDGKFTLMKVECLGSCDTAPVVQVNLDYHESMTVEKLDRLLESGS